MRRHRLATLAMALTAVLGTGTAVAVGPAQATTPGHHLRTAPAHVRPDDSGPWYICSTQDNTLCIAGKGVGNQVTLAQIGQGASSWIEVSDGNYIEFKNNNGHCLYLRGPAKGSVVVEVSSCDPNQSYEQWARHSSPPFYYVNRGTGYDLGYVTAPQVGTPVYGVPAVQGNYWHWYECSGGACYGQ